MFELLAGKQSAHHHICLSKAFRSDLQWWATFLWKVGHNDVLWKFELESASTPCVDQRFGPLCLWRVVAIYQNAMADAISRNNLVYLLSQVPKAASRCAVVPATFQSGSKHLSVGIDRPFLVSEPHLVYFVVLLYQEGEGLSSGTFKSYLVAVRHSQIAQGLGDPHAGGMLQLEYVSKGVKMTASRSAQPCLPITPDILRKLRQVWQAHPNRHNALMLWAAACPHM